ncbi:hypothetical protein Cst_c19250 [Thermoclostridium stercorarium subsp. stercorarium DSM 8532]|uniref:Uncharacterized protein n=3 Tax=Thermoclostridium stercorarium TaxID=1510 RepID=L7VQ19_THES1|nr:hypothetical protein [Thermoclostridium stercorarium]AGC68902.1 hypothetical protein Cst_c19250 [Thermoclostridium stercorarium subsp. stercorarium DSM 8532]ANW99200.1 hypothetical protein CSTERTH_09265 [Thermoclostridium stercorarium subsp. thermolacticum DSM 2910]ANX01758.1 hypothetical protein CSTERLE_09325 [Thermoclostridium stercorarium subsp. leptospartum DSM 9219]
MANEKINAKISLKSFRLPGNFQSGNLFICFAFGVLITLSISSGLSVSASKKNPTSLSSIVQAVSFI